MSVEKYFSTRERDLRSDTGTKQINALAKEIKKARKHDKILDIRAYAGTTMERLIKEHNLPNIKGMEFNKYALGLCKKKGLDIIDARPEKIPFPKDSFDIVYGEFVLESENGHKIATECLRVANRAIFVVSMDYFTKELYGKNSISQLFRKIPDEKHKKVKNVVSYIKGGVKHETWIIVLKRYKKKQRGGVR